MMTGIKVIMMVMKVMFLPENDARQQSGQTFGRLRNHGQCHCHLLRQDRYSDDEQDDSGPELHRR